MILGQFYFEQSDIHLLSKKWDFGFFGDSVDERGDFTKKYITANSSIYKKINYNPDDFTITIAGSSSLFELDEFSYDGSDKTVLVDLTTIGLIELIYLLKIAFNENVNVDLIYCEPNAYRKFDSDFPNIQKQYDLSTVVNNYSSVPGFSIIDDLIEDKEYVFLAGYESNRIEAAFEYKETIEGDNSHIIFGVPAYCIGWETNSFFNNVSIIDNERITGSITYSGATDVLNTCMRLDAIIKSLTPESANLCILPLANKPMSLAAALTLIMNRDVTNLLYDHPMQSSSRTDKIGKIHLYNIVWNE